MPSSVNVLFVCQHGAAKSVIAARHFAELAHARGLIVDAVAAGVEPDDAIPPHVIAGLLADGVDASGNVPQPVTHELIQNSQIVVSFGCNLSAMTDGSHRIIQWNDVPAVSDGYDSARTAILERLHAILDEVEQRASRERPG
jgi:protein-tyrosine-phosphatase